MKQELIFKDFDELLKNLLTHNQYGKLEEALKESPHMTTKLKADPSRCEMRHFIVFLGLLQQSEPELSARDLIEHYGMGTNGMTEEELLFMKEQSN